MFRGLWTQTSRTAPLILSHVTPFHWPSTSPSPAHFNDSSGQQQRPAQGQPQRRRVGPAGEKTAKTPELCPKPANFPSKPTRRRQASRPSHDLAIPSTTSPHGPIGLPSPAPTPIDSRHPVLSPRATAIGAFLQHRTQLGQNVCHIRSQRECHRRHHRTEPQLPRARAPAPAPSLRISPLNQDQPTNTAPPPPPGPPILGPLLRRPLRLLPPTDNHVVAALGRRPARVRAQAEADRRGQEGLRQVQGARLGVDDTERRT